MKAATAMTTEKEVRVFIQKEKKQDDRPNAAGRGKSRKRPWNDPVFHRVAHKPLSAIELSKAINAANPAARGITRRTIRKARQGREAALQRVSVAVQDVAQLPKVVTERVQRVAMETPVKCPTKKQPAQRRTGHTVTVCEKVLGQRDVPEREVDSPDHTNRSQVELIGTVA